MQSDMLVHALLVHDSIKERLLGVVRAEAVSVNRFEWIPVLSCIRRIVTTDFGAAAWGHAMEHRMQRRHPDHERTSTRLHH